MSRLRKTDSRQLCQMNFEMKSSKNVAVKKSTTSPFLAKSIAILVSVLLLSTTATTGVTAAGPAALNKKINDENGIDSSTSSVPTVVHEFASLNYTWDEGHKYEDYVSSERFIVENCLLAGINVDINGDIYLTVPRWRPGVPGTLNKLSIVADTTTATLTPWPSWDMQAEGVEGDLQNVQSMTIDSQRRMWTVEVGRRNFFDKTNVVPGAAGVWIFDVDTGSVLTKYYFPPEVVSYEESFLNDVVVDEGRNVAYFTDAWGQGAIIVFDLQNLQSRRYSGESTQNDPSYNMIINGQFYGKRIFTTPSDGIAITSDYEVIFYCQVQGTSLYRLPTSILRNFSACSADIDSAVDYLGEKQPSDGMKYLNGELFWGSLPESTFYRMEVDATSTTTTKQAAIMATPINQDTMEWVDTFAVDLQAKAQGQQRLLFVSNRLDKYSVGTMDFSGESEGANMRILSFDV